METNWFRFTNYFEQTLDNLIQDLSQKQQENQNKTIDNFYPEKELYSQWAERYMSHIAISHSNIKCFQCQQFATHLLSCQSCLKGLCMSSQCSRKCQKCNQTHCFQCLQQKILGLNNFRFFCGNCSEN